MSDITTQVHQPLPETTKIIKDLKELENFVHSSSEEQQKHLSTESLAAISRVIKLLKNGEPFNPEPHPDSGQGKWKETAAFHARNEEFYRSIINQIGEILGEDAYTADDGSISDSVLVLKLPELIKQRQAGYVRSPEFPDPDTND